MNRIRLQLVVQLATHTAYIGEYFHFRYLKCLVT